MTGPINFNPFVGVGGSESLEKIDDRRKSLRFPDLDLSPVELNMFQEMDDEGILNLDSLDFSEKKLSEKF